MSTEQDQVRKSTDGGNDFINNLARVSAKKLKTDQQRSQEHLNENDNVLPIPEDINNSMAFGTGAHDTHEGMLVQQEAVNMVKERDIDDDGLLSNRLSIRSGKGS